MIRSALLLALTQLVMAQGGPGVEGNWLGTLNAGAVRLRLALKVAKAPDNSLAAKFTSLDQGATELPVARIEQAGLALNGELDLQVPPWLNLPAIAKALEADGNPDYAIVKLPKLHHLFQTSRTGQVAEYGEIEETIAPVALETMSGWILRHTQY